MQRKRQRTGFTLMEMLIVVAIIAVLVAIAIPVFLGQLNLGKERRDVSNARSMYALLMADFGDDHAYGTGTAVTLESPSTFTGGQENTYVVAIEGETQRFTFSDVCTAVTPPDVPGTGFPTVSITTNGTSYTFPGNETGTPATTS